MEHDVLSKFLHLSVVLSALQDITISRVNIAISVRESRWWKFGWNVGLGSRDCESILSWKFTLDSPYTSRVLRLYPRSQMRVFNKQPQSILYITAPGSWERREKVKYIQRSIQYSEISVGTGCLHYERQFSRLGRNCYPTRLDNEDLREYIWQHGENLTAELRLRWARQATKQLIVRHSIDVIQCDVSPGNFFTDPWP